MARDKKMGNNLAGHSDQLSGEKSDLDNIFVMFVDQYLSEVCVNPPVSVLIGIGQNASRYFSSNAHVVELWSNGTQACFDVAETLAIGQLGKRHGQELIVTKECLHLVVALVPLDALAKLVHRHEIHQLSKDCSSDIHWPLLSFSRK